MNEKLKFGELLAKSLGVGDIVEWSKWNNDLDKWDVYYGIITSVKNEMKSNRLVSISKVMPLNSPLQEIEFFTLSLRLVSPSKREELSSEFNS